MWTASALIRWMGTQAMNRLNELLNRVDVPINAVNQAYYT
ncbi:hypothetical protein BH10ACI3_BH10ACI3_28380 [soil metagenome]